MSDNKATTSGVKPLDRDYSPTRLRTWGDSSA